MSPRPQNSKLVSLSCWMTMIMCIILLGFFPERLDLKEITQRNLLSKGASHETS